MLYTMLWVFIGFTILLIPTMHAFKQGDAYEGDNYVGRADTMISNMGYSGVQCRNIPVDLGKIALTCSYGRVGKILDFGVNNPDSGSPIDACMTNEFNKSCKPTNNRIGELFRASVGKERHSVSFSSGDIFLGSNASSLCMDKTNLLFVQYTCI